MSPLQTIVNLIKSGGKILILPHANPDGDAIGSALSLFLMLKKIEKEVVVAIADPIPDVLNFLPALSELEQRIPGLNDLVITLPLEGHSDPRVSSKIENGRLKIFISTNGAPFQKEEMQFENGQSDFDLIISVDTPDLPLLGKTFANNPSLFYETPVINIDHHPSNTGFGKVNLVDTTAASSSEIILRLVKACEAEFDQKLLDPDIATLILTGIITDTGSFQNANTTPRALEIAADLVEVGARQQEIIHHIFKTHKLSTLKLWGRALAKIEFDPRYRLVWSALTSFDFRESEANENEAAGVVDELLGNAPGAEIVFLVKPHENGSAVSIRTTTPAISASEVAEMFGGGGHARAAGFKLHDKEVAVAVPEILKKLRAYQTQRLGLSLSGEEGFQENKEDKSGSYTAEG